ncbi:EamA family transporter (plasmid) [Pseudoalteromonas sp. T1lg65]|uniref:EamA family transporter n=1 Tax=Pseudoalteromonas sp. T1lg65 TaxID=2077101 RepID=UPI003F7929D1
MLLAFFSALCWAGFDYLRKRLTLHYDAALMSVLLSALVLPGYLIYWLYQGIYIPKVDYFLPASISGLLAAIGSVCFIKALSLGRIAVMLPVLSVTPAISGGFAWVWLGDSLTIVQLALLAGIVVASFFLLGGKVKLEEPGAKYILITVVSWGVCIVFDKQALKHSPVLFHAGYITLMVVIINFLLFRPKFSLSKLKPHLTLWFIASVAFASAVIFQLQALHEIQPGLVEGIKRAIGIVSACLVGFVLFSEYLTKLQLLMIGLILVCTLGLAWS